MIEDGRTVPDGSLVDADVCVVGAGPAGLTLALELAGTGARVCVLESGGRQPARATQRLAGGENADPHYYRLATTRLRAFAGTSNHWRDDSGFRTRPLDPDDFEERHDVGRIGWPFPRSELDDAYAAARRICGVQPAGVPLDEDVVLPLLEHGVDTWTFQIGPVDAFMSCWDAVHRLTDVRVLLHATVTELLTEGERVAEVAARTGDGRGFRVHARLFVLALGGIENARLLLLSRRDRPRGIGNEHDLVGRFFMEHPHVRSGVLVPHGPELLGRVRSYDRHATDDGELLGMLAPTAAALRQRGALASAWAVHVAPAARATVAGQQLSEVKDVLSYRRLVPGTWRRVGALVRRPADAVRAVTASRAGGPPAVGLLHGMTEQEPNPDSRVTLGSRRDANGQPVARLDWRLTERDRASIRAGQDIIDEALRAAGLGRIESKFGDADPAPIVGGGFHHMGTTRMHIDAARGVVDATGRVHSTANLYVTGASVFPTGGVSNPTLTIVALAVRLARTLAHVLPTV